MNVCTVFSPHRAPFANRTRTVQVRLQLQLDFLFRLQPVREPLTYAMQFAARAACNAYAKLLALKAERDTTFI